MLLSRYVGGIPVINERYTKGVPFLSEMVYLKGYGFEPGGGA